MHSWNTCERSEEAARRRAGCAGRRTPRGAWLGFVLTLTILPAMTPSLAGSDAVPIYGEWRTIGTSEGLPSDKIFCVLGDGPTVWVGTDHGLAEIRDGEIRTHLPEHGLAHSVINALAIDETTGDLWIATMGGVSRLSGGRIDTFTQMNSGLINDVVYAVAALENDVWFATAAGLSVYQTKGRSWELFNHENSLMHEPWCYSLSATETHLYVGVWGGGVVERDLASGVWKAYRDPDHEMEIDLLRDDGLIHDVTTGVSAYGDVVWAATYFGVSRYDGRRWRSYLQHESGLPSNFVNYVWTDETGVWFCTDDGLAYFTGSSWVVYRSGSRPARPAESTPELPVFHVPHSIAHDFVQGIHADGDAVWVATAAGLSHGRRLPAGDWARATTDKSNRGSEDHEVLAHPTGGSK